MKRNNGFTLIELIVVIGTTAILGLIFTNTLTQTFRGQSKSTAINKVKQNGQSVLDTLSNSIRQAEKVVCVGTNSDNAQNPNDTIVLYKQGIYSRFRFYPPPARPAGCPTDNGCIKRNDFTQDDVVNITTDLCTDNTDHGINSVYILTDTDPVNGVSLKYDDSGGVKKPIFIKDSRAGFNDQVTIHFLADVGVNAGQTYEAEVGNGGILFDTTAQARGGK